MKYPTILAVVLGLLVSLPCFGQAQSTAEVRYVIEGIDGYEVVAGLVLAPEDSQPKLKAVGFVVVETEASRVIIQASDSKREKVEVQEIGQDPDEPNIKQFLVLGSGKIWIHVTCVDFDKQILEIEESIIEIGKAPDPPTPPEPDPDNPTPPEPDPDNPTPPEPDPDNPFNDLTKRIDQLADEANLQVDKRMRMGEIYSSVAARIKSGDIKRSSVAVEELTKLINAENLDASWDSVMKALVEDGKARPPMNLNLTRQWYEAVAAGFNG